MMKFKNILKVFNTFKNTPKKEIVYHYRCCGKNLTKLKEIPKIIPGDFWCSHNLLTSLGNSPSSVGENFHCYKNQLTSLYGISTFIGGHLCCDFNRLTILLYGPKITSSMSIQYNHLLSLDYSNIKYLWK